MFNDRDLVKLTLTVTEEKNTVVTYKIYKEKTGMYEVKN